MQIVVEVVINPQGEIDHFFGLGNNLGLAAEASEKMADIAVVLLDRKKPAPAQAGVRSLPVKS
jgi:hypothetical protein